MADIFDLPDNLSRKGLEKMTGIKYDPDEFFHHKKPGLVEPRYISPIQITLGQIQHRFDDEVYRAVLDVGIEVDKAELIKALNYDRTQYARGYADGLMERPFAKDTNVPSKRQTNADRIRQMSDEELADYHARLQLREEYGVDTEKTKLCKRMWLDWLQQEVAG